MPGSTTFSDAIDVLVTENTFSVAGTFTPVALPARSLPTGVAVPCSLIIARTDSLLNLGKVNARNPAWFVTLNAREIPDKPREDDQIIVSEGPWAGTYQVHTVSEDSFSPSWRCDVGYA
jgi:hypothetical protein